MLAARVAAGKLPPVEKRLPAVPFVRNVAQIGRYGGTLYDQAESPGGRFHLDGTLIVAAQETTRTTRTQTLPAVPTTRAAHIARKSVRTRNRLCARSPRDTRSRATSICSCKAPKEKPYAAATGACRLCPGASPRSASFELWTARAPSRRRHGSGFGLDSHEELRIESNSF